MTTLAAWVGVDQRGMASLYFASDSRISWNNVKGTWDCGTKIFASRNYPEIFGYCDDVLFPTQIISKIITSIDEGILFSPEDGVIEKTTKVSKFIYNSVTASPNNLKISFKVLYGTRIGDKMESKFHISIISYGNEIMDVADIQIPNSSQLITSLGSGSKYLQSYIYRWSQSDIGGTSRSIFSAFCDYLKSGEDAFSGGAPQLVGLYRIGPGKTFGIIYNEERYYNGDVLDSSYNIKAVKWHNELFEICDATTLSKDSNSQAQPRPRNV